MSDEVPPPSGSTLAEVIERTRGRARSLAGLVATATGAVVAGVLFSPAGPEFGIAASVLSGIAIVLLLVCLGLLVYAQIVTKVTEQSAPPASDDERALRSIRDRTRDALVMGAAALVTISATLAVVMVERIPQENRVTLQVSNHGKSRLRPICPGITPKFVGTVRGDMRAEAQKNRIEVNVTAEACGSNGPVTLIIPAGDIVGWSE